MPVDSSALNIMNETNEKSTGTDWEDNWIILLELLQCGPKQLQDHDEKSLSHEFADENKQIEQQQGE